jgi:hypothetical protein
MRTIKSINEFDIMLAYKQPTGNFMRIRYGLAPHILDESGKSLEYFKRLMNTTASTTIGTFMYIN